MMLTQWEGTLPRAIKPHISFDCPNRRWASWKGHCTDLWVLKWPEEDPTASVVCGPWSVVPSMILRHRLHPFYAEFTTSNDALLPRGNGCYTCSAPKGSHSNRGPLAAPLTMGKVALPFFDPIKWLKILITLGEKAMSDWEQWKVGCFDIFESRWWMPAYNNKVLWIRRFIRG